MARLLRITTYACTTYTPLSPALLGKNLVQLSRATRYYVQLLRERTTYTGAHFGDYWSANTCEEFFFPRTSLTLSHPAASSRRSLAFVLTFTLLDDALLQHTYAYPTPFHPLASSPATKKNETKLFNTVRSFTPLSR